MKWNNDTDASSDDEQDYIIEKIVGSRVVDGVVQYQRKYEGFPEKENTWEPAFSLSCFDLIKEYLDKEKRKKSEDEHKVKDDQGEEDKDREIKGEKDK